MARRGGWRVLMRVEDLDTPRIKPEAEAQALDTLAWLGLDWDECPTRQSDDLTPYLDAMHALAAAGIVYPCDLTRAQIEAASSAPQEGAHELRCGPEFRPSSMPATFDAPERSWRFATPNTPVSFDDTCMGPQTNAPYDDVGDFVVWTKRAQPSYQLAVVVDDARQGVTDVVRGDDLAPSTARQLLIADALGLDWSPRFTHLPLVLGPDGKRLAKRHGDTRLTHYRDQGVMPERVIGLLAHWCAINEHPSQMDAHEFRERFALERLPREAVRFTQEDDAWLCDASR